MRNLALVLVVSMMLVLSASAARVKISKKLFCVTEDGSSTLMRGRKELSTEQANELVSQTETKIAKFQEKAEANDNEKLFRKVGKFQTQLGLINECLNPVTDDDFSIGSVPSDRHKAFKKTFTKYIDVFGVGVFGTADLPDSKILHAANILAEYLDNDEDGEVDNQLVVDKLVAKEAAMTMYATENSSDIEKFFGMLGLSEEDDLDESAIEEIVVVQDLFGQETHPESRVFDDANEDPFDGSIEEVLHLITHIGYADAYPDVWAEVQGTSLANAMEAAKAAGHYDPLSQEEDMPFSDQNTEYLYWALTSILGAQDYEGRGDEISVEWQLNTLELLQEQDPSIYNLLVDPQYKFPTRLPDGDYEVVD